MLTELLRSIAKLAWNALCILCRWVVAVKNTILMFRKSQRSAWKEAGGSRRDSTSAYSEMPGELDEYINAKHKTAIKEPIDQDRIRKAGW